MSVRPVPRQRILDFVNKALLPVTRTQIADYFGVSYWSARYYLDKLTEEGLIRRDYIYTDTLRRVIYVPVPVPIIPKFHRVKIRLYNDSISTETPTGQFQGWFDVDTRLKDDFPIFDYWLTVREVEIAKIEMVERFNNPLAWRPVQGTLLAYLKDTTGIQAGEQVVKAPKYPKGKPPPQEYVGEVKIQELIIGLSSKEPVPIVPDKENMGVFLQRLLVIKENTVNYDSGPIMEWIYRLTDTEFEKVSKEVA